MKTLAIIVALFFLVGCASIATQKPGVCDTIPEGQTSVICDLSKQVGQPPETVAGILKIGNIAALAGHLYTAQEASLFIEGTMGVLSYIQASDSELTYTEVVQYMLSALSMMYPDAQAVFIILEDFMYFDFGERRLLSDFDIGLLLKHLNDQKMLIAPFLLKG